VSWKRNKAEKTSGERPVETEDQNDGVAVMRTGRPIVKVGLIGVGDISCRTRKQRSREASGRGGKTDRLVSNDVQKRGHSDETLNAFGGFAPIELSGGTEKVCPARTRLERKKGREKATETARQKRKARDPESSPYVTA